MVSDDEQQDLADLLAQLVGGRAGIIAGDNAATALPLDQPAPPVTFMGRVFVLTGKFAMGPRTACQAQVRKAGGACEDDVTLRSHYLVIGTFGSRDWIHTSHGRKIEKAVEYREQGTPIRIISEQHWAGALSARVPA